LSRATPAVTQRAKEEGIIRRPAYDSRRKAVMSFAMLKSHPGWRLTGKRMETIDDETSTAAIDFIKRQAQANRPFFCWFNSTRMHAITHVRPSMQDQSGISEYFDGMIEHDGHVGQILKALDDLGTANDTIVVYSTDNGPHMDPYERADITSNTYNDWNFRLSFLVVPAQSSGAGRERPVRPKSRRGTQVAF
jgi:arylsulfatase